VRQAAAFIPLLLLAACGRGEAPRAAVPSSYPRIMSMNPCIDAILLQVADPAQIVSISHLSQDAAATSVPLAQARRFPANYGTAEDVIVARPDIVLLEPHSPAASQSAIRAMGIAIVPVEVPASIAQSRDQIRAIARASGHAERGAALVARIDAALEAARPGPADRALPALIRMPDGLVPGAGTLADELLARTGFRNMSGDYGLAAWDLLPLEPLIARPPEVILTETGRPSAGARLLARLRGTRVADFPNRLLQCAGPNLIEAAGRLAAIRRAQGAS
jgi:iron complex transport system substrate-binding protein